MVDLQTAERALDLYTIWPDDLRHFVSGLLVEHDGHCCGVTWQPVFLIDSSKSPEVYCLDMGPTSCRCKTYIVSFDNFLVKNCSNCSYKSDFIKINMLQLSKHEL